MSFELTHVTVLELDLDRCGNRYGALPCTAGTDVHTGTSQVGATDNTIKLAAGASASNDEYNDDAITLSDGRREIVLDYDGGTKIAIMKRNWLRNMFTRSEELDHADWTKTRANVTPNAALAPNGTLTADKLVEDGTASSTHFALQSKSFTSGVQYRFARRAQADERDQLQLQLPNTAFPANAQVNFDLTLGTVLAEGAGADDSDIEDLGGGWFLCWFTATADTTTTGSAVIYLMSGGVKSYSGDGVSGLYVWGAHLDPSGRGEYVKSVATAIGLPDSLAYRAISVTGECYNSFKTCQDKPNFTKNTKALRFVTTGADVPVGEQLRPYIRDVKFAPTEIDLEKGLARRASVTITLADEPCPDVDGDPYIATRAEATGTYWTRLLARIHNYSGRWARIRRAYLTGAWSWGDFVDELYIIDSIVGPDSNGLVKITLKDPVKLTDLRKIPEPSSGKLAVDLGASDLSLTLGSGEGASYASAGYVRVKDEIIQYTANASDVLSWPSTANRGAFNTTAATASIGDLVQICKAWVDASVDTVLTDILEDCGIATANIDTTGFASERSTWLRAAFNITTCIAAPETGSKLLSDLLPQLNSFMWWSPVDQKVKFEVRAPILPSEPAATALNEAENFIEGTVKVRYRDDLRTTMWALLYALVNPVAARDEANNYQVAQVHIDADAEGTNEFNDRRVHTIRSRWFGKANAGAALATVSRSGRYYSTPPIEIEAAVDAKDASIREGAAVSVTVSQLVDITGAATATECIVIKRTDEVGRVKLLMRSTGFTQRYFIIGPNSIGDYPSDPEYGHIAPNATGFSDGTGPYRIF